MSAGVKNIFLKNGRLTFLFFLSSSVVWDWERMVTWMLVRSWHLHKNYKRELGQTETQGDYRGMNVHVEEFNKK